MVFENLIFDWFCFKFSLFVFLCPRGATWGSAPSDFLSLWLFRPIARVIGRLSIFKSSTEWVFHAIRRDNDQHQSTLDFSCFDLLIHLVASSVCCWPMRECSKITVKKVLNRNDSNPARRSFSWAVRVSYSCPATRTRNLLFSTQIPRHMWWTMRRKIIKIDTMKTDSKHWHLPDFVLNRMRGP